MRRACSLGWSRPRHLAELGLGHARAAPVAAVQRLESQVCTATPPCVFGGQGTVMSPRAALDLCSPLSFPGAAPPPPLDPCFPHHSSFSSDPCSPSVLSSPHHPSLLTSHPFPALPPHKCSPARGPSLSPDPPPFPSSNQPTKAALLPWRPSFCKAEVKDLVAMVSASPPPAPPARRVGWEGGGGGGVHRGSVGACAVRPLEGAGEAREGRGFQAEREGKEKNRTGSGAGAYGGRRGTCRAGGCRMVGCAGREGTGTREAWAVPAGVRRRGGAACGGSRPVFPVVRRGSTSRSGRGEPTSGAWKWHSGQGRGERGDWAGGWRDRPEPGAALGARGSVLETAPATAAGEGTRGGGAGVAPEGRRAPNPLPRRPGTGENRVGGDGFRVSGVHLLRLDRARSELQLGWAPCLQPGDLGLEDSPTSAFPACTLPDPVSFPEPRPSVFLP